MLSAGRKCKMPLLMGTRIRPHRGCRAQAANPPRGPLLASAPAAPSPPFLDPQLTLEFDLELRFHHGCQPTSPRNGPPIRAVASAASHPTSSTWPQLANAETNIDFSASSRRTWDSRYSS